MVGCYYGSRSIGGRDPEDPGQEAETQRTPKDDALHGTRAMPYLSRCLSLIVLGMGMVAHDDTNSVVLVLRWS